MFAAKGLNASPGAATGHAVFSADDAVTWKSQGKPTILVRFETTPDDVHGMIAAQGILTAKGGATSHAAVVARGMGKPCVAGCDALSIDRRTKIASLGGKELHEGDWITIDGTTGNVAAGKLELIPPPAELPVWLETFLSWADELRRMEVWANADTPEDAKRARELGAQGIGLCRTEHMFMQQERLPIVQQMILANTLEARAEALAKLLPFQREDFAGILEAMAGPPGNDSAARSAIARVSSLAGPTAGRDDRTAFDRRRRYAGVHREERGSSARAAAARAEPDAGPARLPARHRLSGNLRDAGARNF